ncbi:MAG TPA: hypothetical protein VMJ92_05255, partial [Candidatus Limnocylindrales bacterium]|nr:hypothetical protein [Candidatus Limnocylindrales bacterium]
MASRVPPLVEGPQLERALALARLTGAAMIVFLGPLFPNVGIGFVMAIAAVLLLWTALVRHLAQRGGTPSEQERLARIAFFVDTAVVVYVMWVFSADP